MKQKPAEHIAVSIPSISYVEHRLDNGLRIVMSRNPAIPSVAVNTMFHVGSKDEDPAMTGLAHLFEHLMFEGSPNLPRGKFDEILNMYGGDSNAYTTWDATSYFICLPSAHLETALWLDSDRIAGFGITEKALAVQRDVVAEEKLMYVDNAPYGTIEEESSKRLFSKSGYRWPIIGNIDDLMKADIDDLKLFHRKFYSPSNTVISIVGDIDYDDTLRLIEKYYGGIAPAPEKVELQFDDEPVSSEQSVDIKDNVQLYGRFMFYRMPGAGSKDFYALSLLSGILTDGESSRLVKELEYEKELVNEIDTSAYGFEQAGVFSVSAIVLNGKSPDRVQRLIDKELRDVREGKISESDMMKVKNKVETNFNAGVQSIVGMADRFSYLTTMFSDCSRINEEIVNYLDIQAEDIVEAANRHLNDNQRVILNYLPAKDKL